MGGAGRGGWDKRRNAGRSGRDDPGPVRRIAVGFAGGMAVHPGGAERGDKALEGIAMVADRVRWGVWQVDRERPESRGA